MEQNISTPQRTKEISTTPRALLEELQKRKPRSQLLPLTDFFVYVWFVILVFLTLVLFIQKSYGEPLKGIDLLAIAKMDASKIVTELHQGEAIGVLQGTFGNAANNLDKLLATGKVSAFRAHLLNYTCIRNHNCEGGEPKMDDFKMLEARARLFEALKLKYPNVGCYLSPALEYDITDGELVKKWLAVIASAAPKCTAILNPLHGIAVKGVPIERHGNSNGDGSAITAKFRSNDGANIFDANSVQYQSSARIMVLSWTPRFNLRTSGEKTWTPPSQRTAQPKKNDFEHAWRLLQPQEPKPLQRPGFCTTWDILKAPYIYKPQAEDYNGSDPREGKPLLILKAQAGDIIIYNRAGHGVGFFRYFGAFENSGLNRFYLGSGSGSDGVELMDDMKSEWGWIKMGESSCMLVNVIRRQGSYR